MKVKLYPALAAIAIIAISLFFACRKSDLQKKPAENFDVAAAKEWWYGTFKKTAEYNVTDYESPLAPSIGSLVKKYPSWKRAMGYTKKEFAIVELPLTYQTNKILLPGMQHLYNTADGERVARTAIHKLVLLKPKVGKIMVRTVTIVPSLNYARKKNFDISGISMEKLPADFEGYIMIGGWDEGVKNIYKIENGKYKRKVKIVTAKQLEATNKQLQMQRLICPPPIYVPDMQFSCVVVPTGDDVADQERCLENGHWTDYGDYEYPDCYDDGEGDPENDPCLLYGECGGDGGGGGGGTPVVTTDIINNLNSPCFNQFVNAIGNPALKSFIAQLYQATFVGNGNTLNIQFEEVAILVNPNPPHESEFALSGQSSSSSNTYLVYLNTSRNGFGTQEFWGLTILHEIVHSFIRKNGFNFSGGGGFTQDHKDMLANWVLLMKDALEEIYQIDEDDALALALQGIDDILTDESTGQYLDDMRDYVCDLFQMDLTQASILATGYGDKTKGTACQ